MGAKHSRATQRRRRVVQRGGSPVVGYDGSSIPTAYGAPFEVHAASDPHCGDPAGGRAVPQLGGGRRQRGGSCARRQQVGGSRRQTGGGSCGLKQVGGSRRQTGGGSCGLKQVGGGSCGLKQQVGGGGSAGGVFTSVLNNDLIKMAGFAPNGCLRGGSRSRKQRKQRGGNSYRDLALVSSRPAGYGFVEAVNSDNANYSVVTPYEAMTGGKRQSRRHHR